MNDDHILGYRPGDASGLRGAARTILERLVFPASTWRGLRMERVLCISDCLRRALAAAHPRFAAARVAMQGIPLEAFPPKERPGEAHRPFRVLYAGQLHPYKGVHTLVEAMGLLPRAEFELRVAGAGDPAYEAELRSRAAALGLAAGFLGRLPAAAMGAAYREADALAFTSVWDEPFGLTHLEAMASGTPVVSVGHGGPAEFLVDGANALVFPKEDPAALAEALRRLAGDEALRLRLAAAGRACVEADFALERYTDRLLAALPAAASASAPSAPPSPVATPVPGRRP